MRPRSIVSRVLAIALGVALAFAAIEIGSRVVTALDRNVLDELLNANPYPPHRKLTLIHLVRPHADERVVYELRPGVRGVFRGKPVEINSLGMRDVERPLAKRPGAFRIVVIGDSHAFGWGVRREEGLAAGLEERLNEGLDPSRFEVWNTAVPGYNTVQQVRALELRDLEPDLVLLCHVSNDADLPNFLSRRPDLWDPSRSYAWQLLRRRWLLWNGDRIRPFDLVAQPSEHGRFVLDERRVPERFWPLYGVDAWLAAHRRLDAFAREQGFAVATVLVGTDPPEDRMVARLRALYEELGRPIVDPRARIRRHLDETGSAPPDLWVTTNDRHANATHHRLIAEELREALVRERMIPAKAEAAPQ